MNQNKIADEISKKEGGYRNLNISDIKEVMKLFLIELAKEKDFAKIMKLLDRYK